MNLSLSRLLTGVAIAGSIAFVSACSGAASMSPTGPSASVSATAASSAGASFTINPDCTLFPNEPGCEPPPPPPGVPCSPGYWKNHLTEFNAYCSAAAARPGDAFATCNDLMTALTCKGSSESCGRHTAAALLNTVSGCTED